MAKFNWEDKFVFYLIDKVHKSEYIWNFKNAFYKNKLKKQQFWLQTTEELNKEFNPVAPFTYGEIIKKWNNLKSYYSAENQKVYKAQKSGASVEEVEHIQSSWKFKSCLNFLSAIADPTPSVNNFNKRSLNVLCSEGNVSDVSEGSTQAKKQTSITEFLKSAERSSTSTPISPNSFQNEQFFLDTSNEISLLQTDDYTDSTQSPNFTLSSPFKTLSNPSAVNIPSVPEHVKKKPRKLKNLPNQSLATTLLEASKELTEAITSKAELQTKTTENSAFGIYISTEIDKLPPDLQITAKKQIFSIVMDLQSERIKRSEQ